jgi:hypothetical protein
MLQIAVSSLFYYAKHFSAVSSRGDEDGWL